MNGQTHHVCQKNRKQRGFTLVELLVVIAIIGVLVALLLPAVQAAREAARRAQCTNHLKQIGIAMQNYHDARTELPHGSIWAIPRHTLPENTFQGTWAAAILPYMEQQAIYNLFDFSKQMKRSLSSRRGNLLCSAGGGRSLPKRTGFGKFDANGEFSVTSFRPGDGLIPGKYVIWIECLIEPIRPGRPQGVSYISDEYEWPELTIELGTRSPVIVNYDVPAKPQQ